MSQEVYHIPALLPESLDALDIKPDGIYVDATYGGGGHSRAIVERLDAAGHLYGFDQDEDAVTRAMTDERFTIVYSNFRFLSNFMRFYNVAGVDGILADLGVSFHHFDNAERGFSFRADAPLDMRMNRHGRRTAADIVNEYSEEQLADLLYLYGELSSARRLARAIVSARQQSPITTINRFIETIDSLLDPRRSKKELACVFQALRIEVNGELDALKSFLEQTIRVVKPGGRLAIITYHSLEDRLVKNFMRAGNFSGKAQTDIFGRTSAPFKPFGKPIVPSVDEIEANPRSRSARLRSAIRV